MKQESWYNDFNTRYFKNRVSVMQKTLLFIDDDESIGKLYQLELESEGYNVFIERDGNAALAAVKNLSPDLVVLDIMLPGIDGLTLLEKIKRFNRDLPVIVSTGYSAYRDSSSIWSADDCVIKSSDISELKDKIKKHIKGSKM